jgi:hypothetical protein
MIKDTLARIWLALATTGIASTTGCEGLSRDQSYAPQLIIGKRDIDNVGRYNNTYATYSHNMRVAR